MATNNNLQQLLPELNISQWHYLYALLNEHLELSIDQRTKLDDLIGFRI